MQARTMAQNALVEIRKSSVKQIDISPGFLLSLLKVGKNGIVVDGFRITFESDPIPETAKALRCGLTDSGNIRLLIEDESFAPIAEGMTIPQLLPTYSSTAVSSLFT